jgi:hypothetical protein
MTRHRHPLCAGLALVWLGGCSFFGASLVPADATIEAEGPPERSYEEIYQCQADKGMNRDGLNVADRNVIAIGCGDDMYGSNAASARIGLEEFLYSEVDIDPVYHGIHLILCSQDPKAERYYHIMEKCRMSYELAPAQAFAGGLSAFPGLDAVDVETLVYRYEQAVEWMAGESEKWAAKSDLNPREREIFYDVPHAVLTDYLEHRARYHDIYNFVSGFRATFAYQPFGAQVPPDCDETLTQARAAYLGRSEPSKDNAWELMTEDLGYWITENMVLCHIGLKDYAGALAEAEILKAERREVAVFEKIYSAVAAEIVKDRKMEAKVKGNLAEAKGLVMPYKPTSCDLDCLTRPAKMFASGRPDWEAQIQALYPHVRVVRGVVEAIKDHGKMATIRWEGKEVSWESWNCYDTSVVDHVTPDGRVVYRQQCFKDVGVTTERPPDVKLPIAEVEGMKKGQRAAVVVDGSDPSSSSVIFACQDLGEGEKRCSRVEEILFN